MWPYPQFSADLITHLPKKSFIFCLVRSVCRTLSNMYDGDPNNCKKHFLISLKTSQDLLFCVGFRGIKIVFTVFWSSIIYVWQVSNIPLTLGSDFRVSTNIRTHLTFWKDPSGPIKKICLSGWDTEKVV